MTSTDQLPVEAPTTQDDLDATLSKIADWAFVINQSRADRALISPVIQEMTGWVRDYRQIVAHAE